MFETIAMICYLSISEPQALEAPVFEETPITSSMFTGGPGGDPDPDPKKEKEK